MIKCANPACKQRATYLRDGGVFYLDTLTNRDFADNTGASRRTIWLCPLCCTKMRVENWRPPGEQLRPTAQRQSAPELEAWVLPAAS
jgi:hypothetical protein